MTAGRRAAAVMPASWKLQEATHAAVYSGQETCNRCSCMQVVGGIAGWKGRWVGVLDGWVMDITMMVKSEVVAAATATLGEPTRRGPRKRHRPFSSGRRYLTKERAVIVLLEEP